jgi:mRNA-degrading endonuclease RelE of RelBE toxin-antitoxin system
VKSRSSRFSIAFDPLVRKEVRRIYVRLEKEREGLGEKFFDELTSCYSLVKSNPFGFQLRKGNFRHAMLKTMKYRIVFDVEEDSIYVYEVRHTSRRPSGYGP